MTADYTGATMKDAVSAASIGQAEHLARGFVVVRISTFPGETPPRVEITYTEDLA